jgi:FlaA1/EpsC-like NDP-sugar epimerase
MTIVFRKAFLLALDAILLNIALFTALLLRFDGLIPSHYIGMYMQVAIVFTLIKLCIYYLMGLYRSLWKHASIEELVQVVFAAFIADLITVIIGLLSGSRFPITVYISAWLLGCMMLGGSRLAYRVVRRIRHMAGSHGRTYKRAMIIGAGSAGSMIIKEMNSCNELSKKPVEVFV